MKKMRSVKNDLQYQLFEIEKKLGDYKVRRETIDLATEKNRKIVEENIQRKDSVLRKITERKESLERLLLEKKKSEETVVELKEKIITDKEKLSELFENRKRKIESIHKSRDKIEDNNRKIKENEASLKKLREALEIVIKKLVDAIEKRKLELEDSENERQEVKSQIEDMLNIIEMNLNNALDELKLKSFDRAWMFLEKIDIESLRKNIYKFESYEDGFRSILFDKTGIHAEKENLDKRIRDLVLAIDEMRADNSMLDEFIQNEQRELENINGMITRIDRDIAKMKTTATGLKNRCSLLNIRLRI
jgi:chromosome segregation ATPase